MPADGFDLLEAQRRIFRSDLGALARLVALAICDHWSAAEPEPWPSVARLCRWTGLGRDAVMGAVAALREAEALHVVETKGRVHRYDLRPLMRLPVAETDQSLKPTSGGDQQDQSARPTTTSRPDRHEGTKEKEPKKEPSIGAGAKPKRTRTKAVDVALPPDWTPTDEHRAFAAEHRLALDLEVKAFKGHYEGRTAKSWNGRFTTWLANQAKWNRERATGRRTPVQNGGQIRERVVGEGGAF